MDENQDQLQEQPQAQETFSANPEQMSSVRHREPRRKGKSKALLIAIILMFAVGGGLLFMGRRGGDSQATPTPSPELFGVTDSPEPTTESTATPEPADKAEIAISILNGTGIGGEAGFLQDKLEALGYSKIEVGNASDLGQETTTVTFSPDLPDSITEEITEELESIYEDVTVKTSSSISADIQIVTGLRKGQTPLPEKTATPTPTAKASGSPSPTPTPTATP